MESVDGKYYPLGSLDINEVIGKKGIEIANYLYEQSKIEESLHFNLESAS